MSKWTITITRIGTKDVMEKIEFQGTALEAERKLGNAREDAEHLARAAIAAIYAEVVKPLVEERDALQVALAETHNARATLVDERDRLREALLEIDEYSFEGSDFNRIIRAALQEPQG